jgi:hypothetical protein
VVDVGYGRTAVAVTHAVTRSSAARIIDTWRMVRDSNPRSHCWLVCLVNRCFRPLSQPSVPFCDAIWIIQYSQRLRLGRLDVTQSDGSRSHQQRTLNPGSLGMSVIWRCAYVAYK